jgi:hypothetical protein
VEEARAVQCCDQGRRLDFEAGQTKQSLERSLVLTKNDGKRPEKASQRSSADSWLFKNKERAAGTKS